MRNALVSDLQRLIPQRLRLIPVCSCSLKRCLKKCLSWQSVTLRHSRSGARPGLEVLADVRSLLRDVCRDDDVFNSQRGTHSTDVAATEVGHRSPVMVSVIGFIEGSSPTIQVQRVAIPPRRRHDRVVSRVCAGKAQPAQTVSSGGRGQFALFVVQAVVANAVSVRLDERASSRAGCSASSIKPNPGWG